MAALLALAAVAAGAVGVAVGQQAVAPPPSAVSDQLAIREETAKVNAADAADPRGGPPWAMLEYRTADGRRCGKPGRRVGGQVGILRRDGSLGGTDPSEGGVCVDVSAIPREAPLVWHVSALLEDPQTGRRDPVSFVWGLARPEVEAVRVSTRLGERRAAVGPGGTWIAVLPGQVAPDGATLTALLADGSTREVTIPPPDPAIRRQMLDPPQGQRAP